MVDFRKWLFASAAAALLLGLGSSANAQSSTAFICSATAGNPNIVRSEGVAELVGDLILNCTGGSVTPVNTAIPLSTVQISLNTNVTSRLTGSGPTDAFVTEAILAIDEPGTAVTGATPTELGCVADGQHGCGIISNGLALNFGLAGPYNGSAGHPNLFQGIANGGANQINWQGVPIDAPGTTGTRILRITNIRANACMLTGGGISSSLVPPTVTELIGISGGETIIINSPQQTVALVEQGLKSSLSATPPRYQQCNNLNAFLLANVGTQGTNVEPLFVKLTASEGFGASFKPVAFVQPGGFYGQGVLGTSYNTESGFTGPAVSVGIPGLDETGRFIGTADTATQIQFTITGIPTGVSIYVPSFVPLVGPGGGLTTVIATDGNAAAAYSGQTLSSQPVFPATSPVTYIPSYATLVTSTTSTFDLNPPAAPASVTAPLEFPNFTAVTVSGTTATITYQIAYSNSSIIESLIVPVAAAYITSSSTVPLAGTATSAAVNFAPLSSSTQTGVAAGPIPRFCQPYGPATAFTITACTCNLLFPFVTNQAGFDTGVAIANTSADPYGTSTQDGPVTLWYYGNVNGGPAPASFTTPTIPHGQVLTFQVSSPGSFGVPATAGFQGYIIAQADFQFCHGFAFISDVGAQKLAEGYLAIVLDEPAFVTLRGSPLNTVPPPGIGENEGH